MTVAALYVQPGGVYYGLPDVEPWGLPELDARLYAGPWPVVAHPPCERWGRFAAGGPMRVCQPMTPGDDGGCFKAALAAVRTWGGILEHPEASLAWTRFGLRRPLGRGAWTVADFEGGWTCQVEQGRYGHRARKATWLYACRTDLPSLDWNRSQATAYLLPPRAALDGRMPSFERMGHREAAATPIPFRDLLLSIARTAKPLSLEATR